MFRLYQPETLFKYKRHYNHLLIQSPNTPLHFPPSQKKRESFLCKSSSKEVAQNKEMLRGVKYKEGGEGWRDGNKMLNCNMYQTKREIE